MPGKRDLLEELNAAGGWSALLRATACRRMQPLLDGLLLHHNVHIRWAAQSLVLLKSMVKNGGLNAAEAELMARDLLLHVGDGRRKQGHNGSGQTAQRASR